MLSWGHVKPPKLVSNLRLLFEGYNNGFLRIQITYNNKTSRSLFTVEFQSFQPSSLFPFDCNFIHQSVESFE